ncbi:hypothetical protein BJF79_06730 [Actinomadura sp. CNU-125]|uniref:hypothetical protein n=1 Tax=Actinomadura sp. CNU-125 TaxID=1904961 RepID=UPI00095FF016|nr:hypothetical protein [Actinomadura sp. CNU-125]OLT36298.1 hypothetical protein BJF79_06730 [Actinomadura sp. CNU-125]
MVTKAVEERRVALETAHPGWLVGLSRTGAMWMATRRRTLTGRELRAGLVQSVIEDGADALAERLAEQDATELRAGAVR